MAVLKSTTSIHFYNQSQRLTFPQDAIQAWADTGASMPEELVLFYTIELVRALDAVHTASVLHTCVRADNVLLRHPGMYVKCVRCCLRGREGCLYIYIYIYIYNMYKP